ncbi:MAG: hypothetical protein Q8933_00790 [Bacteroidota bacterium]|nr:hypothetical protein [Bacteroidota bacterium]MDP4189938.1 hypothetical protein [Bacteroidota bacterium]MDP4194505.1 hypothetical protein [Bacteroidota bacterium]
MELEKDNIKVGLVIPGIAATNFFKNTIRLEAKTASSSMHPYSISGDPPEHVAKKILEAVLTEQAEVYADSVKH